MKYQFPKERLAFLLYSVAGVGKSVSLTTLLKIPNLKVRILCLEDNALPAIRDGLAIHNINELVEGQLIISEVKGNTILSTETYADRTDDSLYSNAVKALINFTGIDVATGDEIKLGNAMSWKGDTVLCLDGLTMLQFACYNRGKVKNITKDPRQAFYMGQDALLGYLYQFLASRKCHFILLAHEARSDAEARAKHSELDEVHPALGTRSIVSPFLGRFNNVLYAKYNKQTKQYVWSADEANVMTVARNIDIENKIYNKRKVSMSNLPADFSFEGYNWFD